MKRALEIPIIKGSWAFRQWVQLQGKIYEMTIRFNTRDGFYYMDLLREGKSLVLGLKLVAGVDLLSSFTHKDKPQGKLVIYDKDQKGPGRDPDQDNFGDRVALIFLEEI